MSAGVRLGLESGTVRLEAHDPGWSAAFDAERARLRAALGALSAVVEHVGSTAVPGLVAKPILDLMLGWAGEASAASYVAALEGIGYVHRGEHGIPGRHYFVRDDAAGRRTHHLHMVVVGGALWVRHLAFRDLLRADPVLVAEYAALKQALAAAHPRHRDRYVTGKTRCIEGALRLAGPASGA